MLFRDAKPNKDDLLLLKVVAGLPPARPLSIHQKTQISKFRYYLARQSNTVILFLKSVDWGTEEASVLSHLLMTRAVCGRAVNMATSGCSGTDRWLAASSVFHVMGLFSGCGTQQKICVPVVYHCVCLLYQPSIAR
jgi:hypothetical protein